MDKLLIIAAKLYNDPSGGGGTVVKNLVDTFVEEFEIDLVLYRTPIDNFYEHKNLKTHFHPIQYRHNDKFKRRLLNYESNLRFLINHYDLETYKKIIVVHISKMFGFEELKVKYLCKTILFPMFLSPSYMRSNEIVPVEYTTLEMKVLNSVNQIISPSESEKKDLVSFYGVKNRKIVVIDRGVNEVFFNQPKEEIQIPLKLLVVSTIKEQKNVIESVYILRKLLELGLIINLTIIGRIESKYLYDDIVKLINMCNLSDYVSFVPGVNQAKLAEEMKKSDLLILPSLWETFGRVVYEGMASGLPVVIKNGIDCFSSLCEQDFVFQYSTIDEAVEIVLELTRDSNLYCELSRKAIDYAIQFSYLIEQKKLKEVILCKD